MFVISTELTEYQTNEIPGLLKELRESIPEVEFNTIMVDGKTNGCTTLTPETLDDIREYINKYTKVRVWFFPLDGILHLGITI